VDYEAWKLFSIKVNPVLAVVYAYSSKVFIALVIKQLFSVAGSPKRPEIRHGQYRFLAGYSLSKGTGF